MLMRFLNDDTGATAIEYGLIVAVLSLAVIGGVDMFGNRMVNMFNHFGDTLVNARQ